MQPHLPTHNMQTFKETVNEATKHLHELIISALYSCVLQVRSEQGGDVCKDASPASLLKCSPH